VEPGDALAVLFALSAAASFGGAAALQERAAHRVPDTGLASVRLLLALLRQEGFVPSLWLAMLGFVLQAVALRFGPLTLVQPLLITGTLFFIGFTCVIRRQPPDLWLVVGSVLALAGLTAFMLVAQPTGQANEFHPSGSIPLVIGLVTTVCGCLALARRLSGGVRALPLAVATAICYGVTAGLVRSLAASFDGDLLWLVGQWRLYAIALVGAAGFALNQQAYQKGLIGVLAVATITVGDPAVSIGVGVAWLGESIRGGPLATFGEVVSLLVVAGAIVLLAARSQHLGERIARQRTRTFQAIDRPAD
jgi:drug/metabolite transporter (DMT)-like permease